jgi:glucan 1,3-beta-glucosidase
MAKIRGVNLGGWFVLEYWMKPSMFKDLEGCHDETCFMKLIPNAREKLFKHYETFITEDDFKYLNKIGIKDVRLPVPWWYQGTELYVESRAYIHQAFKWAKAYDIKILLDLHTAPGCQNGFDNGGIQGVMEWHKDQKNIDNTVDILRTLVKEFHQYESFYGIEVLNEPFVTIDLDIIIKFYERVYSELRKITDKPIVFHDAFRPKDDVWKQFFKNKENVLFDLHLYHVFDDRYHNVPLKKHFDLILKDRLSMIKKISKFVDVIVGEWSVGLRDFDAKDEFEKELYYKAFANTQLCLYEQAYGYYFWSYKIDRDSHREWDLKRSIKDGLLPGKF